ncbi:MAG: heavy metal-associated domain-containing protein [Crocinitomicaceae bacterium]
MKTETIVVANLKCSGCANTIKNNLIELEGVDNVEVNNEEDSVTVSYSEATNRSVFIKKLHDLGYPEATEENGLLLKLKSYASCVVGRMDTIKK